MKQKICQPPHPLTPNKETLQTTDRFSFAVKALYADDKLSEADDAVFDDEALMPRFEGGIGRLEGIIYEGEGPIKE